MATDTTQLPEKGREGEEVRTLLCPYKHLRQGRFASQRNEEEKLGILEISMFVKLDFIRRKMFNSIKIKASTENKDHKILCWKENKKFDFIIVSQAPMNSHLTSVCSMDLNLAIWKMEFTTPSLHMYLTC